MPHFYKPHSDKWFEALHRFNPHQAAMTKQIIQSAGSDEVCSICGDIPTKDFQIIDPASSDETVATLRLCEDCLSIRKSTYGEDFVELPSAEGQQKGSALDY